MGVPSINQPPSIQDATGESRGGWGAAPIQPHHVRRVSRVLTTVFLSVFIIAAIVLLILPTPKSKQTNNSQSNAPVTNRPVNVADTDVRNLNRVVNLNTNRTPVVPSNTSVQNANRSNLNSSVNSGNGSVNSAYSADSDQDGLIDRLEAQHRTDPQKADSDNDGLNDFYEIYVYRTNPLNPDTDGDGYNDGEEIRSGHNPLGSG